MGHRRWFKVYAEKWLKGTMRDVEPHIRSIWIDLLALASDGFYGDEGIIQVSGGEGLTDKQIARIFNTKIDMWLEAKQFYLSDNMITLSDDNVIHITNWKKYQSDYQRQKQYRGKINE